MKIHITSKDSMVEALNIIAELPQNGRFQVIIKESAKTRTLPQNNALHLYLSMMAKKLQDAGHDQAMMCAKFKDGFSIPVTQEFLKEVFQTVSENMYQKRHTSELTTKEMQAVYDAFNNGMGTVFGVSLPWPHREEND